ncbi:hypothetical protein Tco_0140489 [Tanacetum coccineum]
MRSKQSRVINDLRSFNKLHNWYQSLVALDLGSTRFCRKVENGVEGVEAAGIDTIEATKKQQDVILIHGGDDYISSLDYDSWIGEWNLL